MCAKAGWLAFGEFFSSGTSFSPFFLVPAAWGVREIPLLLCFALLCFILIHFALLCSAVFCCALLHLARKPESSAHISWLLPIR